MLVCPSHQLQNLSAISRKHSFLAGGKFSEENDTKYDANMHVACTGRKKKRGSKGGAKAEKRQRTERGQRRTRV